MRSWTPSIGKLVWISLACAIAAPVGARAVSIVAPNGFETVDGDTGNRFPFFGSPLSGSGSIRYQQVYEASEFGAIAVGGGTITEIAFRASAETPPFSVPIAAIQINLSTTSAAADGLSAVFADNVGADDTAVFGPAPFVVASATPQDFSGAPKPFEIVFPLLTPFFYDPALGNLLLDMRIPVQGDEPLGTITIDGTIGGSDGTSRAYTFTGDVNSPTADQLHTLGLITRFTATPVPEPSTSALLALGLCALARARRPNRELRGAWRQGLNRHVKSGCRV